MSTSSILAIKIQCFLFKKKKCCLLRDSTLLGGAIELHCSCLESIHSLSMQWPGTSDGRTRTPYDDKICKTLKTQHDDKSHKVKFLDHASGALQLSRDI